MKKLLFLLPAFLFISIAPAFAQDTNLVEKVVKDFNLGEMGIRFLINLVAIFILVRLVYFAKHKNRDFMFTLILFNCVNFLICFLLSGANLGIGFAFGLFAIFSIMRYRTVTVPVKEMGYLFICIAMGLINSLATTQDNYMVLILANVFILILPLLMDRTASALNNNNNMLIQDIIYERIDLIKPEMREVMIADLRNRTGLNIQKIEVVSIDLMQDIAMLKAHSCNSVTLLNEQLKNSEMTEATVEKTYKYANADGSAVLSGIALV
ncbi:MAG: DUF4956 domain-containing protein [Chitinophagaceae bacterium]|nr:DUF4956 domain-containing protein [Chitinophagaceae bacterium]